MTRRFSGAPTRYVHGLLLREAVELHDGHAVGGEGDASLLVQGGLVCGRAGT